MLGKRLRDCKDEAARPESCRGSARTSGERCVELSKPCGRDRAVALREGLKRRVEVGLQIEPASRYGEAG